MMDRAMVNLAGLRFLAKDYLAAEMLYRQALGVDAQRTSALFGLGRVELLQGKHDAARVTLGKLLHGSPKDAPAWICFGDACWGGGDKQAALQSWTQAAKLTGSGPIHDAAQQRLNQYGGSSE
jgi:cytochrome c-type biogenesis protein CcmH/NrfG